MITTGSPTATPSTVAPGGTVTLSAWTVENQGTATSANFSNGFYLPTDAVITTADTYLDGNSNTGLVAGGVPPVFWTVLTAGFCDQRRFV